MITPTNYNFDYRPMTGSILDQGQLGDCAHNALSSNITLFEHMTGKSEGPISRLQSYYDTRVAQGTVDIDSGTVINVMLQQASSKGLAYESSWGYDISKFKLDPGAAVHQEALNHTITSYDHVQEPYAMNWTSFKGMVAGYLDQGKFPIIGFTLKSWYDAEYGKLNTLDPNNDPADEGRGGHAGVIVGMSDTLCGGKGGYIIQNSWGDQHGDHGFMVIPYTEFPGTVLNSSTSNYNIISFDVVTGYEGIDQRWTTEKMSVNSLYVTLFGRAADIDGLEYWAANVKAGMQLTTVAHNFDTSPEFIANNAGITMSQQINNFYVNAFGHTADTAGLNYWLNDISANGAQVWDIEVNIMLGAQGNDKTYLATKTDVAMYGSVSSHLNDKAELAHIMQFNAASADAAQIMKMGIPHDMGWM